MTTNRFDIIEALEGKMVPMRSGKYYLVKGGLVQLRLGEFPLLQYEVSELEIMLALSREQSINGIHIYQGDCPDNTNGPFSRDKNCPVCQALIAVENATQLDESTVTSCCGEYTPAFLIPGSPCLNCDADPESHR